MRGHGEPIGVRRRLRPGTCPSRSWPWWSRPAARSPATPSATTSAPAPSRARTRSTCRRPRCYAGACALGPGIRPAWEIPDPYALEIELTIFRGGEVAWEGTSGTGQLHRRLDDLVGYLFRADRYPRGVILSTGTGLVPGQDFTLTPGDRVQIRVDGVGTLANDVLPALEIG